MLPAQTRKLLLLTLIACVLPATIAAADRFEPSRGDILREVAETLDSTWAYCTDPAGRDGLVARIILPAPNPPTQQPASAMTRKFGYIALQPQGSLNGGSVPYDTVIDGQPLTSTDRENGVEARFLARLFVPAYRVYDPTSGWSPDQLGSASANGRVNFANVALTEGGGAWRADVTLRIGMPGRIERPDCSEVPN